MESNYETVCLCALNTIFGYEPRIAGALLESLGSASAVFALTETEKDGVFGPYSKYRGRICGEELDRAEAALSATRASGGDFIGMTSDCYPERLRNCEDAPVGLFVRGGSPPGEVFGRGHYVAVVGTRDITPYGEQWCGDIIRTLAESGAEPCIVSGLAYGTDIAAHRTAVECGLPTIAVMATGPDTVYPSRHRDFAERIAGLPGCALVTDYPPGTAPVAVNFIRRNRIIAGLSDSVILVESAVKGGGMMTCRLAFSYDRAVFALPGRGDDIRSQGCNHLIREGVAEIVDSLDGLAFRLGLLAEERSPGAGNAVRGPGAQADVSPGVSGGVSRGVSRGVSGGVSRGVSGGVSGGVSCGVSRGVSRDVPEHDFRSRINARYFRLLPEEKISAMTDILLKIRDSRGIDIESLCAATGLSHRNVSELTSLLEGDGMISVDLLRRCTIRRA